MLNGENEIRRRVLLVARLPWDKFFRKGATGILQLGIRVGYYTEYLVPVEACRTWVNVDVIPRNGFLAG